ncbi:MAG TPA: thioredoxin family protein [Acidobacteriota bacterium]|nr:thioredoxin family protein [Acidobacteriota bacterium]
MKMPDCKRLDFFVVLLLLLLSNLQWLPAQDDHSNARLSQFVRIGTIDISIDGSVDRKAQVYQSSQPRAFLIRSPQLDEVIVLQLQGNSVSSIASQHLTVGTDQAQLASDYTLKDEGQFEVSRTAVGFTFDGHDLKMQAKQDLLGFISSQDIRDFDVLWGERQAEYEAETEALQRVRSYSRGKGVEVVTYFGSWCPHCQKKVPEMMKIEEVLSDSDIAFRYYGIPRPPAFGQDPEAIEKKLESVPTTVVLQDGEEVGRLTRDDWNEPEESLAKLLAGL